jgi:hypothetical protein
MQGLQLEAAQGLLAAQGLQGLQGIAAPQGLHPGMAAGLQGLQFTAPQGVVAASHPPMALLEAAAVGLVVVRLESACATLAESTATAAVAITSFFMI